MERTRATRIGYATKPTASNHWIKTGPDVMVAGADASFYDNYPKSADPDTAIRT